MCAFLNSNLLLEYLHLRMWMINTSESKGMCCTFNGFLYADAMLSGWAFTACMYVCMHVCVYVACYILVMQQNGVWQIWISAHSMLRRDENTHSYIHTYAPLFHTSTPQRVWKKGVKINIIVCRIILLPVRWLILVKGCHVCEGKMTICKWVSASQKQKRIKIFGIQKSVLSVANKKLKSNKKFCVKLTTYVCVYTYLCVCVCSNRHICQGMLYAICWSAADDNTQTVECKVIFHLR